MKSIRFFSVLMLISVCLPGGAATWVVPTDDVLIRRAELIVSARVLSVESRLDPQGLPETLVRLWVEEGLKGNSSVGETIEIVQTGGRVGDEVLYVAGAPVYSPGSDVLAFLVRDRHSRLTTMDLSLGLFVQGWRNGVPILANSTEIVGWNPDGTKFVNRDRLKGPFLDFIRSITHGREAEVDYFSDGWVPAQMAVPEFTVSAFDLDIDQGSSVGTSAWTNDGASSINYSVSGTAASGSTIGNDGEDRIIPDDPNSNIPGTFPGSTAVVATAFYGCSGCTFHTVNGEEYSSITYSDVVVNDGVSSATLSQGNFNTTMVHEIGHTLGFRHSDRSKDNGSACAAPLPCSGGAVMNSFIVGGLNGALQSWDQAGANEVYGDGSAGSFTGTQYVTDFDFGGAIGLKPARRMDNNVAFRIFRSVVTCTAVAITSHPQSTSIASGASANLSVGVSGTGPFTYQWFRGTTGDTTNPVGTNSASFNTGALTQTTSFWVRVTNCTDKTASSNTATVTVTECTQPTITTQPQDASITSGQSALLSIAATGTPTITYQWYRHVGGDLFQAVTSATTSTTFNTGVLTSTQFYIAVVRNPCATGTDIQSRVVTVTVASACVAPAITVQPASKTINEGQSTTLTVTATGTTLSYQWFEGAKGDTTKPVGTNSPSFTTPVLTATKSYWVRVSNSCGGVFSDTATVTVTPNCPPGKLCSLGGRFELGLAVRDHRTNKTGSGFPLQQNDLFGFFSLPDFTGDPNNPEVFVKMLDGRPVNGNFWVFYGGLTDLEYTLTVKDTIAGTTKTYFKTGGTSNGGFDVGSGVTPETCVGEVDGTPAGTESPTVCSAGSNRLCLNATRFRVELTARDQRTGATATGQSIPKGDIFGYFALPGLTGDANNPEVFVKVVDGRAFNNFYWVFFSGLTDFEYTLTVVDTFTGQRKTYTKAPGSACGFFDTNAF